MVERDADELQRLWQKRINTYPEGPSVCGGCRAAHETGTVVSVFGDLDVAAAAKAYLCERCCSQRLQAGEFPSLSYVHVAAEHRVRVFTSLPHEVGVRILEGEQIIERINHALEGFVRAGLARRVEARE